MILSSEQKSLVQGVLCISILLITSCSSIIGDKSHSQQNGNSSTFIQGTVDAPILITEYSSFTCSHCKHTYDKLRALQEEFPETVQLHFRPIAFDLVAQEAAQVVLAAAAQGKFWEASDLLFSNQKRLGAKLYEEAAINLGLDIIQFKKDRVSIEIKKRLRLNLSQARALGLKGTPMTFINSKRYDGDRTKEDWREAIKKANPVIQDMR
jgi:protein-disulfide isomerase